MKIKSAISIYVGLDDYSLDDNIKYLKLARDVGIEMVFTSFHMPELNKEQGTFELEKINEVIKELNYKLIIDVSRPMMDSFTIPSNIYALRLDYGFSEQEIVDYSKNLSCFIELNAAVVNEDKIKKLLDLGLNPKNVRLSYNFYPKKYTGLSLETVIKRTKMYHDYGFIVMAYIDSKAGKRPPLYEGLPTIEEHRTKPFYIALQELILAGIDEIGIGDSFASEEELTLLSNANNDIIYIPYSELEGLTVNEKEILSVNHVSRIDQSAYMIRSSNKRGIDILPNHENRAIAPLDIIIDNNNYLRYKGELGIAKMRMMANPRVNLVGYVIPNAKNLVYMLKPGSKFMLVKENK